MPQLLTVGHGTADRDGLRDLLLSADVDRLVDVRRFPGSRRNPDVSRDAMEQWVPAAGIDYAWEPRLGGRRSVPKGQDPAVDGWWRVTAFRGYAAHMRTDEFRAGLDELLSGAAAGTTAIMCSESLWWRCHRRMVADALTLLHGVPVHHLAHDGRTTLHEPSAGALVTPEGLRYDASTAGPG
ncbi:DUF488 domain-containing protein [Nocardioides abyssi]|uniref:DUF488 domain-containing protein n=1 Tax=Nocardioides abyssi TaxID=3058370 RepID=A0ABT8EY31_9ACTN|nr:DUF488 domain-containing protein [Nocardioides abyssi]MDN4162994.1 DUF488 domain-containing protein [Nocardioides abyssi]